MDDIDRLKTVLENIAQINDELKDISEAMQDTANGLAPVELETDPEGHCSLRDITGDIKLAYTQLECHVGNIGAIVRMLKAKSRMKQ